MIYRKDTTLSTNIDAREAQYRHGDVVVAALQTAGRGQRGHKWCSRKGENLTFSLVWEPKGAVAVAEQFILSEAVALALHATLSRFSIDSRIKWTNDIYVGDLKICGVLIEHILTGGSIERTIVGIGLNVNQKEFDSWVPNPTSMSLLNGVDYRLDDVLGVVCEEIESQYRLIESGRFESIRSSYNQLLYRRNERCQYLIPDGQSVERVEGIVRSVAESGALCVEIDGRLREFLFKEIEFVI